MQYVTVTISLHREPSWHGLNISPERALATAVPQSITEREILGAHSPLRPTTSPRHADIYVTVTIFPTVAVWSQSVDAQHVWAIYYNGTGRPPRRNLSDEVGAPLTVIENRFPALFESRDARPQRAPERDEHNSTDRKADPSPDHAIAEPANTDQHRFLVPPLPLRCAPHYVTVTICPRAAVCPKYTGAHAI
jgi:hypothetical protein